MPRKATLSVMGMYEYAEDLFDGFRIPENMEISGFDVKQDIIDSICIESSGLEVLYSEPNIFKFAITKWTNLNFNIWEELQKTKLYEYNPIWNKDGTYTETETRDLEGTKTEQGSSSKIIQTTDQLQEEIQEEIDTTTASQTDSTKNEEGSKTTTESTKAFNVDNTQSWSDKDKSIESYESETTDAITQDITENETRSEGRGSTRTGRQGEEGTTRGSEATTDTGTITRERIEQGNIGVTTTQQMIKEQREVVTLSVERFIIDSFIERFCLLVY